MPIAPPHLTKSLVFPSSSLTPSVFLTRASPSKGFHNTLIRLWLLSPTFRLLKYLNSHFSTMFQPQLAFLLTSLVAFSIQQAPAAPSQPPVPAPAIGGSGPPPAPITTAQVGPWKPSSLSGGLPPPSLTGMGRQLRINRFVTIMYLMLHDPAWHCDLLLLHIQCHRFLSAYAAWPNQAELGGCWSRCSCLLHQSC